MPAFWFGLALIACAFVALSFLIYSLLHLNKLGIRVTHPRVMVEAFLFILFSIFGFLILLK